MSDFSDFLERLIQEDGYSVYGFAQEAGVDRPTLHRVLKGQLVPSAPFFQKVVKTLRLFLLAGISPGRRSCCGAAFPASGESIWWKTLPVKFF